MENKLQNSIEYINKTTGGKSGFSVPSTYFENVENLFCIQLKEENFIKTKGFQVPDSYFNTLENSVLKKVLSTKKEVKIISIKQQILKLIPIATAASIVLFFGINSFIFNKTDEDLFDKLKDSEVENWVANNINIIDKNDFALTYSDIEFDETEIIPNSISNDELENYLNNNQNISLILEND